MGVRREAKSSQSVCCRQMSAPFDGVCVDIILNPDLSASRTVLLKIHRKHAHLSAMGYQIDTAKVFW